jgi:hypothetical protein
MKRCVLVLYFATMTLFAFGMLFFASGESIEHSDSREIDHSRFQVNWDEGPLNILAVAEAELLASNEDRGCCVLFMPAPKCVYANRIYCTRKAEEAKVGFEFYKDTSCQHVGVCR